MIDQGHNRANTAFILEELRKGNERAFDFIFREYYKPLVQFSYSIVKEQTAAESIVQDVFIKLWERRETIENVTNLLSYMMVMVRNQCVDFLRKEKSSSKMYAALRMEESGNTTEEQISLNEFEEKLLKSIMNLPERCRKAMEMSRFEGFSNKEIAEQMQISVKGVEALIGRALKLLRVELSEFLPSFASEKPGNKASILFSVLLSKLRIRKALSANP